MTSQDRAFHEFAAYAATLNGDEKSEAQTFLFHLLEAFGHDANTLPAGSTFEYRVRFPGDRTKFADFVWPGRVLIEMKSRGAKLSAQDKRQFAKTGLASGISPKNFFGLDVNENAVETAKVTLMLARRLSHREAGQFWEDQRDELPGGDTRSLEFERDLPLDNLEANIRCADALFTPWPEADAIIGNPPYLGSRYLAKEHGYDYARKVHAAFPGVPKMADFCVHWFRLAHDRLRPGGRAGLVATKTVASLLKDHPDHREVLFPYMIGRDLVEAGQPTRWIIDFAQREMTEAMRFKEAFKRVEKLVMPVVLAKGEKEKAATGKDSTRWSRLSKRWWQLRDYQPGTIVTISAVPSYIACSRVTKRPVFEFVSPEIHPDNTLVVFPMADDYSFGILQSGIHWAWFTGRCSTLGGTFRYTSDTVFDTFPWPQFEESREGRKGSEGKKRTSQTSRSSRDPLEKIRAVAEAARALRALRREVMDANGWSLRELYRSLELPGENRLRDAHAALDSAVRAAYGMSADEDILAFLLKLNLALADKERNGEAITAPGLPGFVEDPAEFVTADCVTVGTP